MAKEIDEVVKLTENNLQELQKEVMSETLTVRFKSKEEKEEFVEIVDYYAGRGRDISAKIKNFALIVLRDMRKKEEKDIKEKSNE